MKKQLILAISGFKNSGKTTLIQNIIPILKNKGYKVATIKHDSHDFVPDVPNTDTFKHRESGAYGVAIFSDNKFMISKDEKITEKELIIHFEDADIILLEGFKNSEYPKIEVIREKIYAEPFCQNNVLAYFSDVFFETDKIIFKANEYFELANFIEGLKK